MSSAQASKVYGAATLIAPSVEYSRQRRQKGGTARRWSHPGQQEHAGDEHAGVDQRERPKRGHRHAREEVGAAPERRGCHQRQAIRPPHVPAFLMTERSPLPGVPAASSHAGTPGISAAIRQFTQAQLYITNDFWENVTIPRSMKLETRLPVDRCGPCAWSLPLGHVRSCAACPVGSSLSELTFSPRGLLPAPSGLSSCALCAWPQPRSQGAVAAARARRCTPQQHPGHASRRYGRAADHSHHVITMLTRDR